jgi:[acyl-carrier-protein] S-malonyltransferase
MLAAGAKPLEPFGKGSNALKAGTPDAGPEGPTALCVLRGRPFSPRPGTSGRRTYTRTAAKRKLDSLGDLDRVEIAVSFAPLTGRGPMTVAFVFPGQGSQSVGMGKALAETFAPARQVFEEIDAALGERLSDTIWNGPAETLVLTENAQPALMAVSLAVMRVLEAEASVDLARDAAFVAGHSLGEYSALAAAGSLSITDAARLLRVRGRAMQKAVPVGAGAMAALVGVDFADVKPIAVEAASIGVCAAANDNGGGQVVLSGEKQAVERAVEIAKDRGVKRAMMLPVSAPFHCSLMSPAADAMAEALAKVTVKPPRVPLVANVLARPITEPAEIVSGLIEQVTGMVRWRESVLYMVQAGVTTFYEIGAGRVLTGLIKRIADGAEASAIGTPDDIARFKAARS